MKKILLLFVMIISSVTVAQDLGVDAFIYLKGGSIAFYDVASSTEHENLVEVGPTPNMVYSYNNYAFVVNSGEFGAGTNLQVIDLNAFEAFAETQDTAAFRSEVVTVALEANGNAWEVTGINDSIVAVSLTQIGKVELVNYLTGESVKSFTIPAAGQPQGIVTVSENVVALSMADWSDPTFGTGQSVSFMNVETEELVDTAATHLNSSDIYESEDYIYASNWGSWWGDDNYGTITQINKADHSVVEEYALNSDGKAELMYEVDGKIYYRGFDVNYEAIYGVIDPVAHTLTAITEGFFTSNIVGTTPNGDIMVLDSDETKIYSDENTVVATIATGIGATHTAVVYPSNTPVELSSFAASVADNKVMLNWNTVTESNNSGFEIQRSNDGESFLTISFVAGNGTTTEPKAYSFVDNKAMGKVYYRLKQVDYNGSFEYSNVVEVEVVPDNFDLSQNYPNPFNPSTTVEFTLPVNSNVNIALYNILGEKVASLLNKNMEAGKHSLKINGSSLASGVYLYQLNAVGENGVKKTITKKMILNK